MVQRYTWVGIRGMNYSDSGNYVSYEDYQKLEAELEQLRQQVKGPAEDGGWIEWAGGDCPVSAEKLVEIKMRNGGTDGPRKAGNLSWHNGNAVRDEMGCDIIAYRVVKP